MEKYKQNGFKWKINKCIDRFKYKIWHKTETEINTMALNRYRWLHVKITKCNQREIIQY